MKLVYVLKSGKPFILDAYTGDVLGNDGKPYKEDKPAEYTDLMVTLQKNKLLCWPNTE